MTRYEMALHVADEKHQKNKSKCYCQTNKYWSEYSEKIARMTLHQAMDYIKNSEPLFSAEY
jgi:hypothetical protein